MGEIVSTIFSSFTEVITGLAGGVQSAFVQILYKDGLAANGLSDLAKFGFIFMGISLGIGILFGAVRLIRGR